MSGAVDLALGTVQFGLAYGVAGCGEVVPPAEVRSILACAAANGIRVLDTAPGYGDIEERLIGLAGDHEFTVVSKIPALHETAADSISERVRQSVALSRKRLGDALRTILFHRGADLVGPQGDLAWQAASSSIAEADIQLGTSCYSPAEAAAIGAHLPLAAVQMPGNALDQRLMEPAMQGRFAGVELHIRSLFLQGLLLMPVEKAVERVPRAAGALRVWQEWCSAQSLSPLRAALGAAKALRGARYCVVGVDSVAQLEQICSEWQQAVPLIPSTLACNDAQVIDPRTWTQQ